MKRFNIEKSSIGDETDEQFEKRIRKEIDKFGGIQPSDKWIKSIIVKLKSNKI